MATIKKAHPSSPGVLPQLPTKKKTITLLSPDRNKGTNYQCEKQKNEDGMVFTGANPV